MGITDREGVGGGDEGEIQLAQVFGGKKKIKIGPRASDSCSLTVGTTRPSGSFRGEHGWGSMVQPRSPW